MKAKKMTLISSVALIAATALAQSYSIDWHTIDGGGGTSVGGAFSVSGTLGQPDGGAAMSGGSFSLVGGFWSLIAVPTPGAPWLRISLTPTNTAIITWPASSAGFALQQNANLNTSNWVTVSESVIDNGTNRFIIVNPPRGSRYYRLFKP